MGGIDIDTGRKVVEKGLVHNVVSHILSSFEHLNHVAYIDNFYTSAPLVDKLHEVGIFLVGTINRTAAGSPDCLKESKPPKGTYISKWIDDKTYCAFNDSKMVCFPCSRSMGNKIVRAQAGGLHRYQAVPHFYLHSWAVWTSLVSFGRHTASIKGVNNHGFFDYLINNVYLYLLYKKQMHKVFSSRASGLAVSCISRITF